MNTLQLVETIDVTWKANDWQFCCNGTGWALVSSVVGMVDYNARSAESIARALAVCLFGPAVASHGTTEKLDGVDCRWTEGPAIELELSEDWIDQLHDDPQSIELPALDCAPLCELEQWNNLSAFGRWAVEDRYCTARYGRNRFCRLLLHCTRWLRAIVPFLYDLSGQE